VTIQAPRPICYVFPTGDPLDRVNVSTDIVAFSASRSVDGPGGDFWVEILPRTAVDTQTPADLRTVAQLYRALEPNDVITLGVDEEGGITMGLIKRIRRVSNYSGGQQLTSLRLECKDVGQTLAQDAVAHAYVAGEDDPDGSKFKLSIEAALGENNPLVTWYVAAVSSKDDDVVPFKAQGVQDAIDWVLQYAPSMQIELLQSVLGGDGRPASYIDTSKSVTTWNDGRVYSDSLGMYQGTIWGFLMSVIDPDFYEAWIDFLPSDSGVPDMHLIVRPKPFDSKVLERAPVDEETGTSREELRTLIDDLEYHELLREDVLTENLGRGDDTAMSFYLVTSSTSLVGSELGERKGLSFPLIDTYAAKRFGVRKYHASLSLLAGDLQTEIDGDADFSQIRTQVHEFRNRLFNWHWAQPWFEEGSVVVAGRDRYRPGDPFLLPWIIPARGTEIGLQFYCPEITWAWRFGEPYTCTLRLIRGYNESMIDEVLTAISDDAPSESPDHYASV